MKVIGDIWWLNMVVGDDGDDDADDDDNADDVVSNGEYCSY